MKERRMTLRQQRDALLATNHTLVEQTAELRSDHARLDRAYGDVVEELASVRAERDQLAMELYAKRGVGGAIADLLPDHDMDDWEGAMRRLGAERDRYRQALEVHHKPRYFGGKPRCPVCDYLPPLSPHPPNEEQA